MLVPVFPDSGVVQRCSAISPDVERKLHIHPGHTVAVINAASCESVLIPLAGELAPDDADVVIGFVTRRQDLDQLEPLYAAAGEDRLTWLGYPKPGRLGSDLHRDRVEEAVRRHGAEPIRHVSINYIWSALQLRVLRR